MKLYLIAQTKNNDHDSYDSAVVCAAGIEDAQATHPNGRTEDTWDLQTWAKQKDVTVDYLGEASPDLKLGVICASFNAG